MTAQAAPCGRVPGISAQPAGRGIGWDTQSFAVADDGPGTGPSAQAVRILVVEDDYFVALETEEALTEAGFTVVGIAARAEEAVGLAEEEAPDLVLMDIRLAGQGDGIWAAAEIRARCGIPAIFATAHSDAATVARGERMAAPLGWLGKPYAAAELVATVAAALQRMRRGGGGEG